MACLRTRKEFMALDLARPNLETADIRKSKRLKTNPSQSPAVRNLVCHPSPPTIREKTEKSPVDFRLSPRIRLRRARRADPRRRAAQHPHRRRRLTSLTSLTAFSPGILHQPSTSWSLHRTYVSVVLKIPLIGQPPNSDGRPHQSWVTIVPS